MLKHKTLYTDASGDILVHNCCQLVVSNNAEANVLKK